MCSRRCNDVSPFKVLYKGICKGTCAIRELLGGVNSLALAIELSVAHAVWVVVATIGVTLSSEAVIRVGTTAVRARADVVLIVRARMGGESKRVGVGLPKSSGTLVDGSYPI